MLVTFEEHITKQPTVRNFIYDLMYISAVLQPVSACPQWERGFMNLNQILLYRMSKKTGK